MEKKNKCGDLSKILVSLMVGALAGIGYLTFFGIWLSSTLDISMVGFLCLFLLSYLFCGGIATILILLQYKLKKEIK